MKQISVLVTIKSNKIEAESTGIIYGVELNDANNYTTSFRGIIVQELEVSDTLVIEKESDGSIVYCSRDQISEQSLVDLEIPTGDAGLESPAFTGTPTAPTPDTNDNSTKLATTAYVNNKIVASAIEVDPLFFTTGENGLVPLGFRGSDGLAYTYDGTNIIILLANPAAPTGGLVDDVNNLFKNITRNPEYPNLEDYEASAGIGSTPIPLVVSEQVELDVNGFPLLSVGVLNVDAAIGTVGIRVKAVTNIRNASSWLLNTISYTAETQDLDSWTTYTDARFSNTGNNITLQTNLYAEGICDYYFLNGSIGWVQWNIDGTEPGGDGRIALATNAALQPTPGNVESAMGYNWGNNRIGVKNAIGNSNDTTNYATPGPLLLLRMRLDETNLYYEVSDDGGSTWDSHGYVVRPAGDLYIKAFSEAIPAEVHDLVALGVIPVV